MLNRTLQNFGLAIYRGLARSGVLSNPTARSLFLKAYGLYKRLIEAGPVDQLKAFVGPGTAVIDIGANVGFFTLKFADWVGPSGKVFAVEPDRANYDALTRAVAKHGVQSRVQTYLALAAETPGTLRLARNEVHPGDHKIAVGPAEGVEVPALTLDSLVENAPQERVSLVKIDVQGAEMMVLAGAKQTLSKKPALFIEVDDRALRHFGSSADEVVTFLKGFGYRMHQLSADGTTPALNVARLQQELTKRGYVDVLFLATSDGAAGLGRADRVRRRAQPADRRRCSRRARSE